MTEPEPQDGLARQLLKQAETITRLHRELEELTTETTETVSNLLARIETLEDVDAIGGIAATPTAGAGEPSGPTPKRPFGTN